MRTYACVLTILAAVAVGGCKYAETKTQVDAYESFLKQTIGTVEPERAEHYASASQAAEHDIH